jgi:peptidoglycan hydrolase FlgJ
VQTTKIPVNWRNQMMTLPAQSVAMRHDPPNLAAHDARLREAAQKLEANFLAEMLRSAGLGGKPGNFAGGVGEDQFSTFLVSAQAEQMARAGGIGLAESLFAALKARSHDV